MQLQTLKTLAYSAIKPYSSLLFLNNIYAGALLLAITFINPSVAISGIFAVGFTILFAEFLEFKDAYLAQGFYIYNSLLTGMGIGFIFTPSPVSVALIAISSIFTFMLAFMLNRLFSVYKIPILSLPFSIVTMFIYLASLKYSGLLSSLVNNANIYDIELPFVIGSFFHSLGTIFFLPNALAGILISLLILYFSRILFIMAVVGFYFGVMVHGFLIASFTQALYDPYAFNYILVSIALCGVFLLPTLKNFFLALVGVAISVVLTDAIATIFNYYAIPVFTLPFNITVIVFIFILSILYYKEFNLQIKATPEQSLSNYLSKIFRFGTSHIKITPPFSGEWSVYQAFDDEWTHQGKYKYAYDFVKKHEGKSYKNDGYYTQDYFAFGEAILSPVNGYVVDLRHDLVDNIIGEVDRINNWGNYIIIKSDLGFYVEISHLMQFSIKPSVGEYIKSGDVIAKCGNSGYSPEPHIHIQVQELGVLGGFTQEFSFSEYIQEEKLKLNTLPNKGESIVAAIHDRSISSKFIYILDDIFTYEVFMDGKREQEIHFVVKMDEFGEFYLQDDKQNQLYFYNDLKQFYFYNYTGGESHLKQLFIISPRIPFISFQKVKFKDYLPIYLLKGKGATMVAELQSTINKKYSKIEVEYTFENNKIESCYGSASFMTHHKGHTNICYNNIELRRVF
jgi:urea transporter